jgi:RNA polymerase primary sigma factor
MADNAPKLEIDSAVKQYFDSLAHYKTLTKEEEHELLVECRQHNNLNARNKLITCNLRYACKLANAYRNRGVSYSELISEANDGLLEAIDKFDLKQDVKLISYSKWWIMQRMQNAIIKKNRMPASELPVDHEDQYDDDLEDGEQAVKVKQDAYDEDKFIVDDENLEDERNIKSFSENIMSILSDREADIINMYYGRCGYRENTLEDIGKKYNLTKERVRQIMESAFRKIRSESMLVDNKYLSR